MSHVYLEVIEVLAYYRSLSNTGGRVCSVQVGFAYLETASDSSSMLCIVQLVICLIWTSRHT